MSAVAMTAATTNTPVPAEADIADGLPVPLAAPKPRRKPETSDVTVLDLFVILAAATLSLALGMAAHLHGHVDVVLSAIGAIGLYGVLVTAHVTRGRFRTRALKSRKPVEPKRLPVVSSPTFDSAALAGTPHTTPNDALSVPPSDALSDAELEASFTRLRSLVTRLAHDDAADGGAPGEPARVPPSTERLPAAGASGVADVRIDRAVAALGAALGAMKAGAAPAVKQGLAEVASIAERNSEAPPTFVPPPSFSTANQAPSPLAISATLGLDIATAVASENVRIYVEPIQGLQDARAHHVEISMSLVTPNHGELSPADYAHAARRTGLLPAIDALKLPRAARVARRLRQTVSNGAVMTSLAAETLTDGEFGTTAAASIDAAQGARVILSFSQDEVHAFRTAHWQSLLELVRLGVRFAISDIRHLDMDFEALRDLGFAFVKLDAATFLNGLPAPEGPIAAADIVNHFWTLELDLIVSSIADDTTLAAVKPTGAILGQGCVFGAQKLVRADIVTPQAHAA